MAYMVYISTRLFYYFILFKVAGLHANGPIINCRAPLDPLLGETIYVRNEAIHLVIYIS